MKKIKAKVVSVHTGASDQLRSKECFYKENSKC